MTKKVMIIGLDGATWDIFDPVMQAGHMPHLKQLRQGGTAGVLRSTEPPVTPAAWTTLTTGVNPGKHGVFGFEELDLKTNRLHFTNSQTIRFETIWRHLSNAGYKVASLNVPQTYPPFKVNGAMVSGYGCPGVEFNYTYPAELKTLIQQKIPDYDMALHWKKGDIEDPALFAENMAYCKRAFDCVFEMTQLVEDQYGWDVMLAEFQQIDMLQHHILRYLTPDGWNRRPDLGELALDMLDHLDKIIGQLADRAFSNDGLVIVASDHGHGPFHAKIKPNNLLRDWGYLKQYSPIQYSAVRLKRNVKRYLGKALPGKNTKNLDERLFLDWPKTKAVVAHTAQYAFLNLNVKGRHPKGFIKPGAEYRELLEQLRRRFLDVTDERTGTKVFFDVQTPQQLYGISDDDALQAGDLVLMAADGYLPIRALRGDSFIEYAPNDLGGCHRAQGMYALAGASIKPDQAINAHIADIAPTIYAFLGVDAPQNLDGNVLQSAFLDGALTQPAQASSPASTAAQPANPPTDELSPQEQELISQRLADLGYLE